MAVYVIGTLDTKGNEADFLRRTLDDLGMTTRLVDAGCLGQSTISSDVSSENVFAAAGTSRDQIRSEGDRGSAVTHAAAGVANLISQAFAAGEVDGVIGLGGSAGTSIATAAMRSLPIGIPKVMISTMASGQVRPYVGDKDIAMFNSIVDIAGINRISRVIIQQAARAMAGMVRFREADVAQQEDKPIVAATMFGVTTPCVEHARSLLEEAGFEVLVFHATGNGGQAMESLIADGLIAGVLDITTTELADELVGGVLSAGPNRLTAAGRAGIPQVISVGATDMVNFGPVDSIPDRFRSRLLHVHNPTVTLMRTTPEENRNIGAEIGRKAQTATGPTILMLPLKGVSAIDRDGQPFYDPSAQNALFDAIRETRGDVELVEMDSHINDEEFAERAAKFLIDILKPQ